MKKDLKRILADSKITPEDNLTYKIWDNIVFRNKRNIYIKSGVFSTVCLLSLLGAIPLISNLVLSIKNSGLYEYFSVLFSRNSGIALYWKELALSIAESLPVIEILLVLTLVFISILSIKYITKLLLNNKFLSA